MRHFAVALVTALALATFLLGIAWGLPSRAVDPFLFGEHSVWSGKEIESLLPASQDDAGRAADVSERPIDVRSGPVVVNSTDQDRARIVRRYRLMSYQPDEFTTFASLARMKPSHGDLDPRMYKYGGLWVYPVGALLKTAALLRLIDLRADMSWYLDHPEAFARFYVVARVYSACWGLVGAWVAFALIKRITGDFRAGMVGAVCFVMMPLVVNAAHEAKPHLAGAVLMLLAVLAAARFAEGKGSWLTAALLCGAAVAMVPSAIPIVLVLPLMFLLRQRSAMPGRASPARPSVEVPPASRSVSRPIIQFVLAVVLAAGVFVLTNPFVPINLVRNPTVLRSNVGNSAAFYAPGLSAAGWINALLLIGEGTSFLLAAAGLAGAIALGVRAVWVRKADSQAEMRRRATGLLLAAPALVVAAIFLLLAANQPADYARFALPFDLFLLVEAIVAVATFVPRGWARGTIYAVLVVSTFYMGHIYVHHFLRDTTPAATRLESAERIASLLPRQNPVLSTPIEPAPWSMPPADLFRWKIVLDRRLSNSLAGDAITVRPVDLPPGPAPAAIKVFTSCPISWASKPFEVTGERFTTRNDPR